jgi:hypothetical protein
MSYDEVFVGSLAVIIAIVAAAIAVGPWDKPYRLKSIAAIGRRFGRRFGKRVARGVWVAIAVASLTAGFAILTGMRPSYTHPAQRAELDQQ